MYFSPILKPFINNAGIARPLVCAATTIKPKAAAELHSLWLESSPKPARMGGSSGYIMRAFAKAPQISSPSVMTTRSSLFETQSLCIERAIAADPDLSLLGRLAASQQPAAPAAAGPQTPCHNPATLLSEVSDERENFSHSECGRRAVSMPPVWIVPTHSPCARRDGMLVRVWVPRYPPAHNFIKASPHPHFSSLSNARRMKHRSYGAEQLGLNDPMPAKPARMLILLAELWNNSAHSVWSNNVFTLKN